MNSTTQKTRFIRNLETGTPSFGTCITFSDPAITDALSPVLDFAWIDMEHNPLSVERVQGHIIAAKGSGCTPLVRVAWNDAVLIKPVLDVGAAGIIIPMIRSAEEARRAVEACLYPPKGIRGYGPRRPSNYGRIGGVEFCAEANDSVVIIPQLEHVEAVKNVDDILKVPGVSTIVIGPNDLAGSMGLLGQARHPEVIAAIDTIIESARRTGMPVGIGAAAVSDDALNWVRKGAAWVALAADFVFLTQAVDQLFRKLREPEAASAMQANQGAK